MKRVIRHIALSLGLLLAFQIRLSGSDSPYIFENLDFEDMRSIGSYAPGIVETFAQDKFGFIWIGAKDGLYRYDGIDFVSYLFHRDDPYSISSNVISDLYTDSRGNLWIGTENGLNLYNVDQDNFKRFTTTEGLPDNNIRSIVEDRNGRLWIATRIGGIVRKDAGSNRFTKMADLLKEGVELVSDEILSIYLDRDNTLWIGTVGKGIFFLSLDDMELKRLRLKTDEVDLLNSDIHCIGEDQEGSIWFGTTGDGLAYYNKEKDRFIHFSVRYSGEKFISSDNIWSIATDSRGILWVTTDGGGLNYMDPDTKTFRAFRHNREDDLSINSDAVRAFYEDRAGNFWIGHYNAPINYVNTHKKQFFTKSDMLREDFTNQITAILQDDDEDFWYATDGSGLILDRKGDGDHQHFLAEKGSRRSILGNKPMCLEKDSKGNIWIGYYDGGISCYNKKEELFTHYPADVFEKGYPGTHIWDLMAEGDTLWIASQSGIHIMDLKTRELSSIRFENAGASFNHQEALCLLRDSRNRLLIATYTGLFIYIPEENRLRFFTTSLSDMNTLSDKWIITLFEDSGKRIWIGTNNGLNLWDGEDHFTLITMDDGLAGNAIFAIMEDVEGNLWISTNKGLSKYNHDKNSLASFSAEDGLQGNRFRPNANFCDMKGLFIFGGNEGVTFFDPATIENCKYLPPIVFTGLKVIDKRKDKRNIKPSIEGNILTAKEINIYPGQNIFTLEFASLNYTLGHRNEYMYMLEGFDDNWHHAGNQHFATYTNLSPGTYTFRVKGSNHDGIWNSEGASIRVVVHPPVYRSFWFIGGVIILGLLVIFFIYWLWSRHMRMRNVKLARLVKDRTQELEIRNKEIAEQNKRIIKQRDLATVQRDQIVKQKEELEKHRTRLEELIEERTQELVDAKERAEESDRLKTAFLENISHEIRTPMNAIIGFINLLADKIDDKVSREYYLRIINESGKNMLRLIQDIVDFSRMQTGHLQPEYSSCRVNDLLRDLVTESRARASREKPDLNIVASLPEEEFVMYTDVQKVNQIFSKLLENSIKFTEKGHISIGIQSVNEKWITFFVKDTGIGIKPEHIEKIFDRFYTVAGDDRSDEKRDSGLGLAFAKVITELLGGEIWAESKDESGSEFYFKLPFMRVDLKKEQISRKDGKRFSWSDKKILVAEDEESNYLLIEAILKDTGVSIIHCEDGVELLEKINDGLEFDLVLLDLKMPRMGGINAMKLIRESNKDVPVIVQTAYDQTSQRNQCKEAGCNDFLVKPLRKRELLETIEKYLG